jgi:hypothetical protein
MIKNEKIYASQIARDLKFEKDVQQKICQQLKLELKILRLEQAIGECYKWIAEFASTKIQR